MNLPTAHAFYVAFGGYWIHWYLTWALVLLAWYFASEAGRASGRSGRTHTRRLYPLATPIAEPWDNWTAWETIAR